eukprot:jgi/Tetstr1/427498/TSEL_017624.t1
MLTFLSELRGRHVLLYEDNMGVVYVLANLTSRSPLLMTELRKLWFVLDYNDISISARYIKTTANIWADRLSREIDYDDWAFSLMVVFPPSPDLFAPGRLGGRTGVGPPKWPVVAFRLPLRARRPASDF